MGQATSTASAPAGPAQQASTSGCPVKHDQISSPANQARSNPPAECPVPHTSASSSASAPSSSSRPAECPVSHGSGGATKDTLNPLNNMPELSQSPAVSQQANLPTDREVSSIPRGDDGTKWEYPSPQQFYNALVRKGWETPEEHVEMMVHIHNFLNERAWDEVMNWERRVDSSPAIDLARLRGRPGELSPKARLFMLAGWLLPDRFSSEPPFDRHDWVVRRRKTGEEVRYVIDYYSLPDAPDGSPVFSLDVRPALDSVGSAKERLSVAAEETWTRWRVRGDGDGNPGRS